SPAAITDGARGARRTDSAFPRFRKATKASDIVVIDQAGQEGFAHFSPADLRSLPGVAQVGSLADFSVVRPPTASLGAPADGTVGGAFFKQKMLAGRRPRADRQDEVTVSFVMARNQHLRV